MDSDPMLERKGWTRYCALCGVCEQHQRSWEQPCPESGGGHVWNREERHA